MSKKFGFDLLERQVLDRIEGDIAAYRYDAKGDSEIEKLFHLALNMVIKFGYFGVFYSSGT